MRNIIEYKNLIWVDIIKPDSEDIKYLKKKFKLHSLTLKTIIPAIHHPDLDIFKNYIFLILHHPHIAENGEIEIREFDIIVGKNYLITNHYETITPLNSIFEECLASKPKRMEYMDKGASHLLFIVLNAFLRQNLEKIDQIGKEIDLIEKEIFLEKEKKIVQKISYLKTNIIDFWRIIEPQETVFWSLKSFGSKFFGQESTHYFSVLSRVHRKTENALRNSKETINSLEETNHILVNLKMNDIIRILTIFSVILLPLTLLASIWGMNTNFLPFTGNSSDFWLIIGLMVITLAGMIIYFRFKKWL